MKKLLTVLFAILMIFTLVGCVSNDEDTEPTIEENINTEEVENKTWVLSHEDCYRTDSKDQDEYLYYSADITFSDDGTKETSKGKEYDSEGIFFDEYKTESIYDENGNLIKYTRTYATQSDSSYVIENEYDEQGRLIKQVKTLSDDTKDIIVYEYTDDTHYTYKRYENEIDDTNLTLSYIVEDTLDENGNIVASLRTDETDPDVIYEIDYEYDNLGKVIKCKTSLNDTVFDTISTSYDEYGNIHQIKDVYKTDDVYYAIRKIETYTEVESNLQS